MQTETPSRINASAIPRPMPFVPPVTTAVLFERSIWSAPAERSGDGALDSELREQSSKAVSPLRSATALQITSVFPAGVRSQSWDLLCLLKPSSPDRRKIQTDLLC